MFWKKRENEGSRDPFQLEYDPDKRMFFRVKPSSSNPVFFQVGSDKCRVRDLGAGGASLWGLAAAPDTRVKGLLYLPEQDPVPLVAKVLEHDSEGTTRVQFVKIREADQERIHLYVLQQQKEEMEERRKKPGR